MIGEPAVRWVIALKAEAKPIIKQLKMIPSKKGINFPVYSDRKGYNWLIISNVGQSQSAAATNYLCEVSNAPPWAAWINLGVAGYGHDTYGSLYMVDRITLEKSNIVSYPGVALLSNLPRAGLLTVDRPRMDYSGPDLIDMEGFSFYKAASKLSCRELLVLLKVVSDGPKSDVKSLTSKKISNLISENIDKILSVLTKLEDISKLEGKRQVPPDICGQIKERWHFTVTQEHQLNILIRRWVAVFPERILPLAIKNKQNSKSVISYLSKSLDEYQVDWGHR